MTISCGFNAIYNNHTVAEHRNCVISNVNFPAFKSINLIEFGAVLPHPENGYIIPVF